MTPDGPPYLGATGFANLFVNVGQGSNGWTQACGCGRVVADIVSGSKPDIDRRIWRRSLAAMPQRRQRQLVAWAINCARSTLP